MKIYISFLAVLLHLFFICYASSENLTIIGFNSKKVETGLETYAILNTGNYFKDFGLF